MQFNPGEKILNGATVLLIKYYFDGTAHVLAHYDIGRDPYVTWNLDTEGNASSGHYFTDIAFAARDFASRVAPEVEEDLEKCPTCGDNDYRRDTFDPDGDRQIKHKNFCTCDKCGTTWVEIYGKVTEIDDVSKPKAREARDFRNSPCDHLKD